MAPNPISEVSQAQLAGNVDCAKAEKMTLPQLLYYVLTGPGSAFHGAHAAKQPEPVTFRYSSRLASGSSGLSSSEDPERRGDIHLPYWSGQA